MEQQLFNPAEYRGLNGQWNIELDLTVDELDFITKESEELGMELNDYISYVLIKTIVNKGSDPDLTCPTCGKYRSNNSEPCPQCGEIDL